MIDVEQLKKSPGVLSVYSSRVSLKKDGDEWIGLCPIHKEKTPSFRVSLHQGTLVWRCFGQCNRGGDVISFVQAVNNVGFKEAVAQIKQELGTSFAETKSADNVFSSLSEPAVVRTYSLQEFQKQETALAESWVAREWLKRRGISYETAKKLHLGYRQDIGQHAKAADGWLSFPSVVGDRVLSIKYRSLNEKTFYKHPGMSKGDQTPLFNPNTIEPLEPVFLVEGEIDCATLEQAGFHAVSCQSASTPLTAANKELLLQADYVVLAGDNDPAGNEYTNKLWAEMKERTFKLSWPDKDANETFLNRCKGDIPAFKALVEALLAKAKSVPMPNISSLPEVMMTAGRTNLTEHPNRLHFPWKNVDSMAVLLPGSVCSIMATSTKQGKSTFVAQTTIDAAINHEEVVLNYQCELSPEEFSTVVTANLLKKDRNHLTEDDYHKAAKLLYGVRYYVGRDPTLSTVTPVLDLIEAGIRRLGATLVVLDHVHFICRNEANETQAQANAMQRIKRLAVQYGVKFIVVGQPRKSNQQFKGKLVDISDWKGSEAGISDADAVFALHRDRIVDRDENTKDDYDPITSVHLLGCRSRGDGGTFSKLIFLGKLATFSELSNEEIPGETLFNDKQTMEAGVSSR